MAAKKPLKITDKRRYADPPKLQPYMRPGGYQSYLGQVNGLGEPGSGMAMFKDRRGAAHNQYAAQAQSESSEQSQVQGYFRGRS